MLTELMQLVERNEGEMDLNEISQYLQAQPSAVAGMVETLIRKGRLTEVVPTCGPCDSCGVRGQCSLRTTRVRRYSTTNRGHADPE